MHSTSSRKIPLYDPGKEMQETICSQDDADDEIREDTTMKLAVASGKGGTGKSMVAANLAFTLSQSEPGYAR